MFTYELQSMAKAKHLSLKPTKGWLHISLDSTSWCQILSQTFSISQIAKVQTDQHPIHKHCSVWFCGLVLESKLIVKKQDGSVAVTSPSVFPDFLKYIVVSYSSPLLLQPVVIPLNVVGGEVWESVEQIFKKKKNYYGMQSHPKNLQLLPKGYGNPVGLGGWPLELIHLPSSRVCENWI